MNLERRTILHAAWAAPVIVVATATPATAASPLIPITIEWSTLTPVVGETISVRIRNVSAGVLVEGVEISIAINPVIYRFSTIQPNGWTGGFSSDHFIEIYWTTALGPGAATDYLEFTVVADEPGPAGTITAIGTPDREVWTDPSVIPISQ